MKKWLILCLLILSVFFTGILLAQSDEIVVPGWMNELINQDLVLAAVALLTGITGLTKLIRNLLGGVKGPWAVVITCVVAIGASLITLTPVKGFGYAAIVGAISAVLAAGIFKVTKVAGKKIFKE